ncbi:hypothetical protein [Hymenobacter guriensis]|uniref:DUF1735 domain-containing protein n=1 Tax=Hymenobacter guriensis TaxID=2793065 RepID=A0ABS0L8C5_9BACT|nr:hypothetical protein [Hymenobacter guriensis]MBG8556155.1 hypothetical protein [Hymenobacter guriensis]
MKTLFYIRTLFLCLSLAAAGCGGDEDEEKTAPKSERILEVRYSGAGLTGLGAAVSATSASHLGNNPDDKQVVEFSENIATPEVSATKSTNKIPADYDVSVRLSFLNVKPPKVVPAGSYLTADLYIDGTLRKTVRIDNKTPNNGLFVTAAEGILYNEW